MKNSHRGDAPRDDASPWGDEVFGAGGPELFAHHWQSGTSWYIAEYRRLIDQDSPKHLASFLQGLASLDSGVWRDRAKIALKHWFQKDTSCNLGSGAEWTPSDQEIDDLACNLQGTTAAVLAAEAQRRWERAGTPQEKSEELRSFAQHAGIAMRCLADATPLDMNPPELDVPAEGPNDVSLPRPQAALVQAVRSGLLALDQLPSCGWLTCESLLGDLLGCPPQPAFEQEVHLLLYRGDSHSAGVAEPVEISAVPASHPGLFVDRAAAGGLLIYESMRESLRLAHDWARHHAGSGSESLGRDGTPLAIRIRPRFRLDVVRLLGASGGVLLACAMRGVLEQRRLNHHATATACLAAGASLGEVTADAVADESILAKLRATWATHPRLTHVLMEVQQAEKFRSHRDITALDLTIHGVQDVQAAYDYLTREAQWDDVLRDHGDAVAGLWGELTQHAQDHPDGDFHRLEKYVQPRYGVRPPGKSPLADSSRDDRAFESTDTDAGALPADYDVVEGEGDERVLHLLSTGPWLCATEDAGAGKTVLSLKAASLAALPQHYERLFNGRPLIVRLESAWPVDEGERPLPFESLLFKTLRDSLGENAWAEEQILNAARHALKQKRVLLILDGWDQFSQEQRDFIRERILQPGGPATGCRVLLTSRAFAVQRDKATLFRENRWRFARIAGFNRQEQAEYLRDLDGRWQRMVPRPEHVQDLLRIPDVLRMIRQIVESTEEPARLPEFQNRGQLYLEASQRMLERALEKHRDELPRFPELQSYSPRDCFSLLRHVIGLLAFQMCLERRYDYTLPGLNDGSNALDDFLEEAWQRFDRSAPASLRSDEVKERWKFAVEVLKKIEWSHRGVLEAWTQEILSFRSRKMMEWYAAWYLANHATDFDLLGASPPTPPNPPALPPPSENTRAAIHFTHDDQWYWVWRFAIEMPRASQDGSPARAPRRLGRSLSLLFRPSESEPPPAELIYRSWHLFELEAEPKIRDKFPYETDDEGRAELLPEAGEVVRAWRWVFWQRFRASDEETQREALGLVPEDLLWSVLRVAQDEAAPKEILLAARCLGLNEPQLRELGVWLRPHRQEILRRWRRVCRREWPADPWPGEAYHPERAYQDCPPLRPSDDRFPMPPESTTGRWTIDLSQGAADDDSWAFAAERPRHPVRLAPFQLQTFCVTQAQYALFDAARSFEHADDPVTRVNWFSSWAFCKMLGPAFRLPTESEYELAIRGGTETAYWWRSNDFDPARCSCRKSKWSDEILGRNRTQQAGCRYFNRHGLAHMAGNVAVWVWDFWQADWYRRDRTSLDDEGGPAAGERRVCRGGSFNVGAEFCRSSHRFPNLPEGEFLNVGFRPCRVWLAPEPASSAPAFSDPGSSREAR